MNQYRRGGRMPTHLVLLLLALTLIASLLALPARVLAERQAEDPPVAMAEGLWKGAFGAQGPYSAGTGSGVGSYSGLFTVASVGAQLTGEWTMDGTAQFGVPEGSVAATVSASGTMHGNSNQPVMEGQAGTGHIVGTVAGVAVDETLELGPGDFAVYEVRLTDATCSIVNGDWTTTANLAVAAAGGVGSLTGGFTAIRTEDIAVDDYDLYAQQIKALLVAAETLRSEIEASGGLPEQWAKLETLLGEAANLVRSIKLNSACGFTQNGAYIGLIAHQVESLLLSAMVNPDKYSTYDLLVITASAYEMGVLGSGAANPTKAASLTDSLVEHLATKLENTTDCGEIATIQSIAMYLNHEGFLLQVGQAYEGQCGGN